MDLSQLELVCVYHTNPFQVFPDYHLPGDPVIFFSDVKGIFDNLEME